MSCSPLGIIFFGTCLQLTSPVEGNVDTYSERADTILTLAQSYCDTRSCREVVAGSHARVLQTINHTTRSHCKNSSRICSEVVLQRGYTFYEDAVSKGQGFPYEQFLSR